MSNTQTSQHFKKELKKPLWLAVRFENNQDLIFLTAMADQLYQFTPHIEFYFAQEINDAGLLLEISSCLHLFHGKKNLCEQINTLLKKEQNIFYIGMAQSTSTAWLLSFTDLEITDNIENTNFIAKIKSLPLSLLHDFPLQVDALYKMGFHSFDDLAQQIEQTSIAVLKERFSEEFVDKICDIFSIDIQFQQVKLFSAPRDHYQPKEIFCESVDLEYPVKELDQLIPFLDFLLQTLEDYLRLRQEEAQTLHWKFFDIYRQSFILTVISDKPQTAKTLFLSLTRIQLEQQQLMFEVDSIELSCETHSCVLHKQQLGLFRDQQKNAWQNDEFAMTTAKLKARLGEKSVYKLSYVDAFLPEQSVQKIALSENAQQKLPAIHQNALRPKWLMNKPLPIEERKQGLYWQGWLNILVGPERMQTQWWNQPIARDYFLAERQDHQRLWIFFDLHLEKWFVQGIFS